MDHDTAVAKHHRKALETLEQGFWDDVYRETPYFEQQKAPHPPYPDKKGLEKGEFDVLYVNYNKKIALYKEIKTKHSHMKYAEEQIQRAQQFFNDTDWKIIGTRILEK